MADSDISGGPGQAGDSPATLLGLCPACGQNLDKGGNLDCETCAAEPVLTISVVRADERDLIVVIVDGPEVSDQTLLDYLTARFPGHRALPVAPFITGDPSYVEFTDSGLVVILDAAGQS
jgi:hypothetical protein